MWKDGGTSSGVRRRPMPGADGFRDLMYRWRGECLPLEHFKRKDLSTSGLIVIELIQRYVSAGTGAITCIGSASSLSLSRQEESHATMIDISCIARVVSCRVSFPSQTTAVLSRFSVDNEMQEQCAASFDAISNAAQPGEPGGYLVPRK